MRCMGSVFVASFSILAAPAMAQRTQDNVVVEAEDAFGRSLGSEAIGLYSEDEVRGFSPAAAGNIRLEGMYFDRQGGMTARLVEGSAIHVGLSAQGYPFPAPTGIADLSLRTVGSRPLLSTVAFFGPFRTFALELDGQFPVAGKKLGLVIGGALRTDEGFQNGDEGRFGGIGISADYRPADGIRLRPFWGRSFFADDNATPTVVVAPAAAGETPSLPPRIDRKFFGQHWTDFNGYTENFGLLADAGIGHGFELRAGLFRSRLSLDRSFFDLYLDTNAEGQARHLIIADPRQTSESSSGELRLTNVFVEGARRHALILSLRGRDVVRRYGGSAASDFGQARIGVVAPLAEPDFAFGERSRDDIGQRTFGLGYELRWRDRGELNLGVQKTRYRKLASSPGSPETISTDAPLLWSAAGAIHLSRKLAAYAGMVRGLEESGSAPAEAVNRSEAPPALRTRQWDAGLRYRFGDLTLIGGVFDVRKPYFNVDSAGLFRRLGEVRHRGVEISVAGQLARGLSLVAGTVVLDARVSGPAVESGIAGKRPVGVAPVRAQANIDYALPSLRGVSVDASITAFGRRIASLDNRLKVPATATVNIGGRYRFQLGRVPATLRIVTYNLFDTFGWVVAGSGSFTTNGPRRVGAYLALDL